MHDCHTWTRLDLGGGEHWVNYHHERRQGVDWVLVEHMCFERQGALYGNDRGVYEDNTFRCEAFGHTWLLCNTCQGPFTWHWQPCILWQSRAACGVQHCDAQTQLACSSQHLCVVCRFCLLSLAACEAAMHLQLPEASGLEQLAGTASKQNNGTASERAAGSDSSDNGAQSNASKSDPASYDQIFGPERCSALGDETVFVANDWHAGMVPVYLKHRYKAYGHLQNANALLAVHNLAYQGTSLAHAFPSLSLPNEAYHELEWIYTEKNGKKRTPVRFNL